MVSEGDTCESLERVERLCCLCGETTHQMHVVAITGVYAGACLPFGRKSTKRKLGDEDTLVRLRNLQ